MKRKARLFTLLPLLLAGPGPFGAVAAEREILLVVTSADRIKDGKPTGLWLEEFAVPYRLFRTAGFRIVVASPKGGAAPIDPRSLGDAAQVEGWTEAVAALKSTVPLAEVTADRYVAIFLPGGHGTMFDLPGNPQLQGLLRRFHGNDKVVAAVCHGPAGLVGVTDEHGVPLVSGKIVTAFTDDEERAIALDKEMPFLLETRLREEGAMFVAGPQWAPHVEVDGRLVTGQNPASSAAAAEAVIRLLQ